MKAFSNGAPSALRNHASKALPSAALSALTKAFSLCVALALVLSLCAAPAHAAKPAAENLPDFISYGDYGKPVGQLQKLLGVEERDEVTRATCFGEDTLRALKAFQRDQGLAVSGEFDAETLYLLLDLDPQWIDEDPLVWIPMHGGAHYHAAANCSGMRAPQQTPEACAYALGFNPCLICFRELNG